MPQIDPAALDDFALLVTETTDPVYDDVDAVRRALATFRATNGWDEFLADVPPVDVDAATALGLADALAGWVSGVSDAFQAADDLDPATGLVVLDDEPTVDPLDIDGAHVLDTPYGTIVVGTRDSDHVQVVQNEDGSWSVVVRRWDEEEGRLVTVFEEPLDEDRLDGLVVSTGSGDDVVALDQRLDTGVTVWTGDGNDAVGGIRADGVVDPSFTVGGSGSDRIFLGEGNDLAHGGAGADRIYGGGGDDTIDGQDGVDRVFGGNGDDTAHGGRGNDHVSGGNGADSVDGGSGRDIVRGGSGADIVSGAAGNDVVSGGDGHDVVLGGTGDDDVTGGRGDDVAYVEDGEAGVAENVVRVDLSGTPGDVAIDLVRPTGMSEAEFEAWRERVNSDLELLRSTPSGRESLLALDALARETGREGAVNILPAGYFDRSLSGWVTELFTQNDWFAEGGETHDESAVRSNTDGSGPVVVGLDTAGSTYSGGFRSRSGVVLLHELAHAFDALGGGVEGEVTEIAINSQDEEYSRQMLPNAEVNATGLDTDGDGAFDFEETADGVVHPDVFTENAIREELGLDPRERWFGEGHELATAIQYEE